MNAMTPIVLGLMRPSRPLVSRTVTFNARNTLSVLRDPGVPHGVEWRAVRVVGQVARHRSGTARTRGRPVA